MSILIGSKIGLLALLALIPLIILYLIRPKPQKRVIPSLMFFMKDNRRERAASFFKTFLQDLLFVVQLAVLALLAFSIAQPYILMNSSTGTKNLVIVLDASASMQATGRFEQAVGLAKEALQEDTNLILIKNIPYIALQDAEKDKAIDLLNDLKPYDTGSNIGDAILMAGNLLKDKGEVLVISDFINTEGSTNVDVAKRILESKGHTVNFVNVGGAARNIGFVNADISERECNLYIKNYNNAEETVNVNGEGFSKQLVIKPGSIEVITISTPKRLTQISLDVNDDFELDNKIWINNKYNGETKVLLITSQKDSFLESALKSSGEVELEIATPPIIPEGEYDIYIFDDFDPKFVVAGTFRNILKNLKDGSGIIINAQDNLDKIDFEGALPVSLGELSGRTSINVHQNTYFTTDIEFGYADKYFKSEAEDETEKTGVIASAEDGSPLIVIQGRSLGRVVYYGLFDAGFRFSPTYPIFWTLLIEYLTNKEDINNLNYKTGELLNLGQEQTVKTPEGTITASMLILDQQGVYEFDENDAAIAANLLSEKESDINAKPQISESVLFNLNSIEKKVERSIELYLIIIALVIIFAELLLIKTRGDL